jgi:hypothetical protein
MPRYFAFIILLIILCSCEKNIDLDIEQSEPVLVVDAQIENNRPPVVVLTKSLGYFGEISIDSLAASFVHDAIIHISNGVQTHRLKEYAVPLIGNYTAWYYSIDSSNLATAFEGALQGNYSLEIISDGKSYHSTTTIPDLNVVPDSIWTEPAPNNPDTLKRILKVRLTDPPGLGNRCRYFTQRNSEPMYPGESSVWNDQLVDGHRYTLVLSPGFNKNLPPDDEDNFFIKGDTIVLKIANIDKITYDFWETWEFAFATIGNPFSQPNTVIGNISNGALGAFCGYAAEYYTLIAE